MKVEFDVNKVTVALSREEYIFIFQTLSYVVHGVDLDDDDFRNILCMEKGKADDLARLLQEAEHRARSEGRHWNPL